MLDPRPPAPSTIRRMRRSSDTADLPPLGRTSGIAAICGLRAEARIAAGVGWRAAAAGGDPAATRAAAERLVGEGAGLLVSLGIAGGLDPSLAPGAVIVADRVVGSADVGAPLRLGTIAGLRGGALVSASAAIATTEEKRALFAATGAVAVDLESGIVAEVAAAACIPYLVLRAIADPASRELPPAARLPLRRDGTPDLAAVLGSVARDPRQLPGLLLVARDTRTALAALRRAALRVAAALTIM